MTCRGSSKRFSFAATYRIPFGFHILNTGTFKYPVELDLKVFQIMDLILFSAF